MQRHFPTKEAWGAFLIDFVSPVAVTLGSREEGPCAHSLRTSADQPDQEWTSRVAKTSAIKRSYFCRLKNMEDIVSTVLYNTSISRSLRNLWSDFDISFNWTKVNTFSVLILPLIPLLLLLIQQISVDASPRRLCLFHALLYSAIWTLPPTWL